MLLFVSMLLGRIWPVVALRTYRDPGKIERHLETLCVRYSIEAVDAFCSRFGARCDSDDLVMDFDGGRDFDGACERFLRCCRVRRRTTGSP